MTERVQKLIDYLEKENLVTTYNNQWFDSRNTVGDYTETVYSKDGIIVDYCEGYEYFEVFGLSDEEFTSLEKYFDVKYQNPTT